ncbi:MAG: acyl-CoA dehydrogenase family protein [Dehalococcoidia bacterium]|nr:acyl-CoA dehydrogenase family protein [Dehalococcoidia bacterium]
MDWKDNPQQAEWRATVRQFIKDRLPEGVSGTDPFADHEPTPEMESWRKSLAEVGWIAPHWPKEYGGAGLTTIEQFILSEEFAESDAPRLGGISTMMLGPTIIAIGNEDQKREHLPPILRGETVWCQGYSEPGSGSDLASLQSRAVRDGDDFVLNGQKIWTSGAHRADWMFCLARTDPDAPKHRGITYFLIDMKTPGITVRPLVNLNNFHHFNEVFFEDVRVPARNVVGEVNRGWYVGATTLDFERSSIGGAVGAQKALDRAVKYLNANKAKLSASDYSAIRHQWADRAIETSVARHLAYRIASMQAAGQIPNSEASIAKMFASELSQRVARTNVRMLGMFGQLTDSRAPFNGESAIEYCQTLSSTIAGGTSEIQRNIIATRGLGLPRG